MITTQAFYPHLGLYRNHIMVVFEFIFGIHHHIPHIFYLLLRNSFGTKICRHSLNVSRRCRLHHA